MNTHSSTVFMSVWPKIKHCADYPAWPSMSGGSNGKVSLRHHIWEGPGGTHIHVQNMHVHGSQCARCRSSISTVPSVATRLLNYFVFFYIIPLSIFFSSPFSYDFNAMGSRVWVKSHGIGNVSSFPLMHLSNSFGNSIPVLPVFCELFLLLFFYMYRHVTVRQIVTSRHGHCDSGILQHSSDG